MPLDEIDEALRRQPMWDPPARFSRQVAAAAMRLPQPRTVEHTTALATVWQVAAGVVWSCSATVSGYTWMVRQYWALLAR